MVNIDEVKNLNREIIKRRGNDAFAILTKLDVGGGGSSVSVILSGSLIIRGTLFAYIERGNLSQRYSYHV